MGVTKLYEWIAKGADSTKEPDIKYGRFVSNEDRAVKVPDILVGKFTNLIKTSNPGAEHYVASLFAGIEYHDFFNRADFPAFMTNLGPLLTNKAGFVFDIDMNSIRCRCDTDMKSIWHRYYIDPISRTYRYVIDLILRSYRYEIDMT